MFTILSFFPLNMLFYFNVVTGSLDPFVSFLLLLRRLVALWLSKSCSHFDRKCHFNEFRAVDIGTQWIRMITFV